MHEYSLAEGLLLAIKSIMNEERLKEVTEVVISVGSLAQVDREILLELLNMLGPTYGLSNTKYTVTEEESSFQCSRCGFFWSWSSIKDSIIRDLCGTDVDCDNPIHLIPDLVNVFVKCPNCGSPDFRITSGYDVRLVSIRGVRYE